LRPGVMSDPSADDEQPLDPAAARIVARVRWLMLISGITTLVAIVAVVGVLGYPGFKAQGSSPPPAAGPPLLPHGPPPRRPGPAGSDRGRHRGDDRGRRGRRDPHVRGEDAQAGRPASVRDRAVTRACSRSVAWDGSLRFLSRGSGRDKLPFAIKWRKKDRNPQQVRARLSPEGR